MFQLEHRLVAVAEIFRSPKAQTAFIVVRHIGIFAGLLGDTGIDDSVYGDVRLCLCSTGENTGECKSE